MEEDKEGNRILCGPVVGGLSDKETSEQGGKRIQGVSHIRKTAPSRQNK